GTAAHVIAVLLAFDGILLLHGLLVGDGRGLYVRRRHVTALPCIAIERSLAFGAVENADQGFRQIDRVMDAAVHAHGTDWAVDVGWVACKQDGALAEGRSHALSDNVGIIDDDFVGLGPRIEALQLALRHLERRRPLVSLVREDRSDEPENARRTFP